jgi:hypothetical protein
MFYSMPASTREIPMVDCLTFIDDRRVISGVLFFSFLSRRGYLTRLEEPRTLVKYMHFSLFSITLQIKGNGFLF